LKHCSHPSHVSGSAKAGAGRFLARGRTAHGTAKSKAVTMLSVMSPATGELCASGSQNP